MLTSLPLFLLLRHNLLSILYLITQVSQQLHLLPTIPPIHYNPSHHYLLYYPHLERQNNISVWPPAVVSHHVCSCSPKSISHPLQTGPTGYRTPAQSGRQPEQAPPRRSQLTQLEHGVAALCVTNLGGGGHGVIDGHTDLYGGGGA